MEGKERDGSVAGSFPKRSQCPRLGQKKKKKQKKLGVKRPVLVGLPCECRIQNAWAIFTDFCRFIGIDRKEKIQVLISDALMVNRSLISLISLISFVPEHQALGQYFKTILNLIYSSFINISGLMEE